MQDRFKFRWYSKIYNEMCDVNCIEPNNEFVNFQQGKFNDISTKINLENGVLMQCTGLKDKNGTLIYEGDILQCNQMPTKGLCEWFKDGFWVNYFINGAKRELRNMHNWYEVIGNIYEDSHLIENLELLKREQQ